MHPAITYRHDHAWGYQTERVSVFIRADVAALSRCSQLEVGMDTPQALQTGIIVVEIPCSKSYPDKWCLENETPVTTAVMKTELATINQCKMTTLISSDDYILTHKYSRLTANMVPWMVNLRSSKSPVSGSFQVSKFQLETYSKPYWSADTHTESHTEVSI